jgi:tRNA dimethylallyltransferase
MSPLLVIVGPTAIGKTRLAIDLARRWNAEIVGCDASQVYRGMTIGTGKATAEELAGVPHHLLDVVDPGQHFDAMTYARLADTAIADIRARHRQVIVCGGTGLYLRALLEGLSDAPPTPPEVRAELQARIAAGELAQLYAELAQVDPPTAQRLAPTDTPRIERALGVFRSTGKPLSQWHAEQAARAPRHPSRIVRLTCERAVLGTRIEKRVRQMFASGLVDEVRGLLAMGVDPAHKCMAALGYRPVAAHLQGALSLDAARAETVLRTRQYAKRQETWFKRLPDTLTVRAPVTAADLEPVMQSVWGGG